MKLSRSDDLRAVESEICLALSHLFRGLNTSALASGEIPDEGERRRERYVRFKMDHRPHGRADNLLQTES
jgi:hypothetical protein